MTDTDRMVVWLREALDAAEQRAEAAARETGSADWAYQEHGVYAMDPPRFMVADVDYLDPAPGKFIAANDPAAVLRRITADRKLLEIHDQAHECVSYDWVSKEINPCMWVEAGDACTTVRLLAEGRGWTETRSWPECMCTPSGECGKCWEKRQLAKAEETP